MSIRFALDADAGTFATVPSCSKGQPIGKLRRGWGATVVVRHLLCFLVLHPNTSAQAEARLSILCTADLPKWALSKDQFLRLFVDGGASVWDLMKALVCPICRFDSLTH